MSWRSSSVVVLLAGVCLPASMVAQKGIEGGVQAQATFADYTFAGGGLHFSLRPGGRSRFTLAGTLGAIDGELAMRAESTAHFMLSPRSRKRGVYVGGGVAGLAGPVDEAYLLLVIGIESGPGSASGWSLEGGIGGGVRLQLGYRWRKLRLR